VENVAGINAIVFTGSNWMVSSFLTPLELTGNPRYTVSAWVWNGSIDYEECYLSWSHRGGPETTNCQMNDDSAPAFGAVSHWSPDMGWGSLGPPVAGAWHHLAVSYDGNTERLYADGLLREAQNKSLNIYADTPVWLGCAPEADMVTKSMLFSGAIGNISVYDDAYDPDTIAGWASDWPPYMLHVPVANFAELKAAASTGELVKLTENVAVTCRGEGLFFIGEERFKGCIKVEAGSHPAPDSGTFVANLTGTVSADAYGQYTLTLSADPEFSTSGPEIKPVGMNNKTAVNDPSVLTNLVRVWGNVLGSTIDDGYGSPITVNGGYLDSGVVALNGVLWKESGRVVIYRDVTVW
jgi:hypothetical protein